jgi:NAD(P)-dependent dehydrogenase (short-subunit alcohol dehydrogenase family)
VVVVTGASAGLGRAISIAFGRKRAAVALIARNAERLEAAADDVKTAGGHPFVVPTDVASWTQVGQAAERIERELGPIDVWVNNAMSSIFAPFSQIDMVEFARANDVNYMGFVHGTKAALDVMLPRDKGVIVQVGSALAYRGIPLQSAYCGAKHAIVGFTEALRTELLHDGSGVRVTMVHMPAMNTPQFDWVRSRLTNRTQPVPPIYQPEVGARSVVYASKHPRRRAYYVGMTTTLTVLGNKFVPGALDRYLARKGYDSQQTDEPEDPMRPDNLMAAVPGAFGAHGRFDGQAHARSPWTRLTHHRPG